MSAEKRSTNINLFYNDFDMKSPDIQNEWNDIRIRSYKKESWYSYACGIFPTIELLEAKPSFLFRVILSEESAANKGAAQIRGACAARGIPVITDDKTLQRISPKENCYAAGVFRKYEERLNPLCNHIVLVHPADKGNLGTMIRTMAAFRLTDLAVILPAADYFDPKVIRASMGALFRIRIRLYHSFEDYCRDMDISDKNRLIFPFMLKGAVLESPEQAEPIRSALLAEPPLPYSLVFGNESSGLDDGFLSVGQPVRIMHSDQVDALNLTTAAGIGMHWFYHKGGLQG